MRPDVIIHIGPPKTGTTSLQVAFDDVKHPDYFYAGTFQPRSRNCGSLCQILYRASSDKSNIKADTSKLRAEISKLTRKRKTILFSEEMFLLEQEEVSIRDKISNLREVVSGFDCRILISARSGKSALPSLYQEIFKSLPFRLRNDFEAFCRDRRATCYDYVTICDMLVKSGFEDIVLFDFRDLSKQNLNLGVLTGCDEFNDYNITAQRHNAGLSGNGGNDRFLPRVSLKNLGDSAWSKSLIKALNLRKWPGYRRLVGTLDQIEIRPSGNISLSVPHDVAHRLEISYTEAFRRFGQTTLKKLEIRSE